KGRLPWEQYGETIKKITGVTPLFLSAHTGFIEPPAAKSLKQAGVIQALIDVMGDEETATRVYHLSGLEQVHRSLEGIKKSGLDLIPHIVAGLYYGNIRAEYEALEIIRRYRPKALVIVVLTPLKGTPMFHVSPPSPLEIGRLIARARLTMPEMPISLGCERPRNRDGWVMEKLAIRAGANRMAVWSDSAVQEAKNRGLRPRFQATCCSLSFRPEFDTTGPPGS
ncbi:radical SAM protein, partial [Methanosarcinales archaeon]